METKGRLRERGGRMVVKACGRETGWRDRGNVKRRVRGIDSTKDNEAEVKEGVATRGQGQGEGERERGGEGITVENEGRRTRGSEAWRGIGREKEGDGVKEAEEVQK